jgi:hypothetical protein
MADLAATKPATDDPDAPVAPEAPKSDDGSGIGPPAALTTEIVVPDRLDEKYQTTKWEIWAYYA